MDCYNCEKMVDVNSFKQKDICTTVKTMYEKGELSLQNWKFLDKYSQVLVHIENAEVVAAIEYSEEIILADNGIMIDSFEVISSKRREGIGTRFVQNFCDVMSKSGINQIVLLANDEKSERFWRKNGFVRENTSDSNEIFMVKDL